MDSDGIIYTLRATTNRTQFTMRFIAENDDDAIFEVIDFILFAVEKNSNLWANTQISLKNPLGVTLLNIPAPMNDYPRHG